MIPFVVTRCIACPCVVVEHDVCGGGGTCTEIVFVDVAVVGAALTPAEHVQRAVHHADARGRPKRERWVLRGVNCAQAFFAPLHLFSDVGCPSHTRSAISVSCVSCVLWLCVACVAVVVVVCTITEAMLEVLGYGQFVGLSAMLLLHGLRAPHFSTGAHHTCVRARSHCHTHTHTRGWGGGRGTLMVMSVREGKSVLPSDNVHRSFM
jgi:hypothetical protein